MNAESRNTRIVACLIASMTLGAAVLLWLEPPRQGWADASLLVAENGQRIDQIIIHYHRPDEPLLADSYDCLVMPDGQYDWRPRGRRLRLSVLGTWDQALAPVQARALLILLGNLSQGRRDLGDFVRLDTDSDARVATDLPPQAYDLTDLLIRKGIIR